VRQRHARWFVSHRACAAVGIDRDLAGVADLAGDARYRLLRADLEAAGWPLGDERFAAVVVTNYLWRPLLPALVAAVDAGGVLLYETFARGQDRFGRPRRPEFLLEPGELLECVRGALHVVAYEHGVDHAGATPRAVQRLAAVRGDALRALAAHA
jgi:hypothetical protein